MSEHGRLLARRHDPYALSEAARVERQRDADRGLENPPAALEARLLAPVAAHRPRGLTDLLARGRETAANLFTPSRHR